MSVSIPKNQLTDYVNTAGQIHGKPTDRHHKKEVEVKDLLAAKNTKAPLPTPKSVDVGNTPEIENIKKTSPVLTAGVKTSSLNLARLVLEINKLQRTGAGK